jgi:hypothetical protein
MSKTLPQFEMKLLGDIEITKYCIKIDYYMWDNDRDDVGEVPHYLAIDTKTKDKEGNPMNLLISEETMTPNLRVFDKHKEAVEYMLSRINNPCYGSNPRVIKIRYNFKTREWEEC